MGSECLRMLFNGRLGEYECILSSAWNWIARNIAFFCLRLTQTQWRNGSHAATMTAMTTPNPMCIRLDRRRVDFSWKRMEWMNRMPQFGRVNWFGRIRSADGFAFSQSKWNDRWLVEAWKRCKNCVKHCGMEENKQSLRNRYVHDDGSALESLSIEPAFIFWRMISTHSHSYAGTKFRMYLSLFYDFDCQLAIRRFVTVNMIKWQTTLVTCRFRETKSWISK